MSNVRKKKIPTTRKEAVEIAEEKGVFGRCGTCSHYQRLMVCGECSCGSRYRFAWREFIAEEFGGKE